MMSACNEYRRSVPMFREASRGKLPMEFVAFSRQHDDFNDDAADDDDDDDPNGNGASLFLIFGPPVNKGQNKGNMSTNAIHQVSFC